MSKALKLANATANKYMKDSKAEEKSESVDSAKEESLEIPEKGMKSKSKKPKGLKIFKKS